MNHLDDDIKKLLEKYPFINFLTYGKSEYLGVIQNIDQYVTNFYDYGKLNDQEQKTKFLTLGEQWWWESNRLIPINIFLKQDWVEFKFCLRTFNTKDVVIKHGPEININALSSKRIKRKQIVLVKKL